MSLNIEKELLGFGRGWLGRGFSRPLLFRGIQGVQEHFPFPRILLHFGIGSRISWKLGEFFGNCIPSDKGKTVRKAVAQNREPKAGDQPAMTVWLPREPRESLFPRDI